jgi:hypothetical protein
MVAILPLMLCTHRLALLLLPLLAACASAPQTVGSAATTPLRDLNVVKAEIPPLLQQAQQGPYVLPANRQCSALAAQVAELDAVLGPDLDAPPEPRPDTSERAQDEAGKALQRAAEGAVPFRGWLRRLSGAERQDRRVAAAVEAGEARRAFLRGLRVGLDC